MAVTKNYVIYYPENCRKRYYHARIKNKIVEFVVQLEVYFNGKWRSVIRYDTSHGFAHRDIIHFDGTVEKTPLFIKDFNDALNFANADINANWQIYKNRFTGEGMKDD